MQKGDGRLEERGINGADKNKHPLWCFSCSLESLDMFSARRLSAAFVGVCLLAGSSGLSASFSFDP